MLTLYFQDLERP